MRNVLLPVFLWIILLLAMVNCSGHDSGNESVKETGSTPGPDNHLFRIFVKPFAGQYTNSWPFDHDLPLGVFSKNSADEGNSNVLTWRGETIVVSWGDGKFHDGYDWGLPEGTPLFAVADGEIVFADREEPFECGSRGLKAALIVTIRHITPEEGIFESQYVHLSRIDVRVGEYVEAGQQIGLSGNTGCSSGPHLHFSVYRITDDNRKVVVDPFGWEGSEPDPWEVYTGGVQSLWLWKKGQAPEGEYSF